MADSFFSGYTPAACTTKLTAEDYAAGLVHVFQAELGHNDDRVSPSQAESLYSLVRGRYWTGRDVNLNLRFGRMIFPFMHAPAAPSHRAKSWLTLVRPPWLRRYSYRLRFANRRPPPRFLAPSYWKG